MHYFMYY